MSDVTLLSDRNQALPTAGQPNRLMLEQNELWTDGLVDAAGIPVYDVPLVSVGGGIGSFVTVDFLRVAGVPASDIRVLSNLSHPWQTYEYLAQVSQLSRGKRIRSDAASRPDNLWGFPSFAIQEAIRDRTLRPLLQVLLEPVFADFYTPRLGAVLDGIAREARRIRYWDMLVQGQVRTVRRRAGGGYFTLLTPRPGEPGGSAMASSAATGHIAYRSRDVHVAVGYPALRFPPDMQRFRQQTDDFTRVVNGYEDHEHVYQALRRRGGVVLVRGGGIVSSAVLERLINDRRRYGSPTKIVQLFRTYFTGSHGPHAWARRRGGDGFAYQGFNYPKSAWGGQLKARMRRLEGSDRARLYDQIGGTTTAPRRHWRRGLADARCEGWYLPQQGTIVDLRPENGAIVARIRMVDGAAEIPVDYVIDCTGLDFDVTEHEVLKDLLRYGGARRNPLGRLDVERSFELRGAASEPGRIYVTGAASFGGYFPGVDTFLGLQLSAQEVVDDISERGYCRHLGPARSLAEWLKWVTGREI